MRISSLLLLAASVAPAFAQDPVTVQVNLWAQNINRVTDIAHCGDTRLFVTEQAGVIKIITDSMQVNAQPFLDIQGQVLDAGNEQGLLGMAFDPDYATNGFFYLNYTRGTGTGISRISRWHVSGDPDVADAASEQVIYEWPQPFTNHNGGDLEFGPDGMLYIGFGDGGDAGDPLNNAQDPTDPLGNMIRIDVSDPDTTFTIPPDNPFVGAGPDTLPEIWASGLRNPYRFGFDALTGDLWIGDVGQNTWEEIDRWPAGDNSGPNFGWRCYEGNDPYNTGGCLPASFFVDPVVVQQNWYDGGDWCSSIGGRVYRGSAWPRLEGRYVYTDYCGGEFRSLRPDGAGGWIDEQLATSATGFSVIAEDHAGELFTGNNDNDRVYRIVDKCPMDPPDITQNGNTLMSTPANGYTWYLNGTSIPASNNDTLQATQSGTYWTVGDMGNGCLLHSDTIDLVFNGVIEIGAADLRIAPDPAADRLEVMLMNGASGTIRLVDVRGRIAGSWPLSGPSLTIDVSAMPAGTHAVQWIDEAGAIRVSRPVMIVH